MFSCTMLAHVAHTRSALTYKASHAQKERKGALAKRVFLRIALGPRLHVACLWNRVVLFAARRYVICYVVSCLLGYDHENVAEYDSGSCARSTALGCLPAHTLTGYQQC